MLIGLMSEIWRLWLRGRKIESSVNQKILKIAKLEIVGNEWEELGQANMRFFVFWRF